MSDISKTKSNIIIFPDGCQETILSSEPAISSSLAEMDVQVAGFSKVVAGYKIRRYKACAHIVIFTIEGEGLAHIDDEFVSLQPGSVFLAPACDEQYYLSRGNWTLLWFHLLDTPRWSHLKTNKSRTQSAINSSELQSAMRQQASESLSNMPNSRRLAQLQSEIIAIMLERELRLFTKPADIQLQGRLSELWSNVYENPQTQWTLGVLAKKACFSPFHLSRLCRSCHSVSPMRMVAKLRMRKAKELLFTSDCTIDAIAERVGYGSPFAFSNAFKRECGCSPKTARRGWE